jgi:ABC-type sugar transport system ATPase subunit
VVSLIRTIAASRNGVILVTHDLSTVRILADRLVVLSLGCVVYDALRKVLALINSGA